MFLIKRDMPKPLPSIPFSFFPSFFFSPKLIHFHQIKNYLMKPVAFDSIMFHNTLRQNAVKTHNPYDRHLNPYQPPSLSLPLSASSLLTRSLSLFAYIFSVTLSISLFDYM